MQQSMFLIKGTIPEGYNLYNINSTFISPIYTFFCRETIVHTPNQATNREKYFNHNIYKGKNADLGGE